jgi:hypothetical protein
MNPDDYEFGSYSEEFNFDLFNTDPYDMDVTYDDDYDFASLGLDLTEVQYNPLDF